MIQQLHKIFNIAIKKFLGESRRDICFTDPISADEFQLFETFFMNHLGDSDYHSHFGTRCQSPKLEYSHSYRRYYTTFRCGSVIEAQVEIPVFRCESCGHYHALLPYPLIVPYRRYALSFILAALLDMQLGVLTVEGTAEKYQISVSTLYRWRSIFQEFLAYYRMLRDRFAMGMFISLLYSFMDVASSIFSVCGRAICQHDRRILHPPGKHETAGPSGK